MQAFAKPKSAMRTAPSRSRLSIFGGESRVRTPAEKTAVRKAVPAGVLTKVVIEVGFELVALVTRQAIADLGLVKGSEVFAVFKASAVHLIPKG